MFVKSIYKYFIINYIIDTYIYILKSNRQIKGYLKGIHIYGCQCNQRLKAKTEGCTRLVYNGLRGPGTWTPSSVATGLVYGTRIFGVSGGVISIRVSRQRSGTSQSSIRNHVIRTSDPPRFTFVVYGLELLVIVWLVSIVLVLVFVSCVYRLL